MAVERQSSSVNSQGITNEISNQDRGITLRAVIIGFLATIPGVFWGVYGDVVSQTDLTSTSLMMPPILIITFLLIINSIIRRLKRKMGAKTGRTHNDICNANSICYSFRHGNDSISMHNYGSSSIFQLSQS